MFAQRLKPAPRAELIEFIVGFPVGIVMRPAWIEPPVIR